MSNNINLGSKIGLPIVFEEDEIKVDSKYLTIVKKYSVYVKDLHEYYLNPITVFPKIIYKTYWIKEQPNKSFFDKLNTKVKIFLLYPQVIGIEYAKSKTIHSEGYPRVIESVSANIKVILHPPNVNEPFLNDPKVVTYIVDMPVNTKIVIPPHWHYTIVNVDNVTAVVVEIHHEEQQPNNFYAELRGSPFYIIQRNSSQEIVKNPNYKNVTKYATLDILKINKNLHVAPKTPILKQFLRKHEKFSWFYSHHNVDWYDFLGSFIDKVNDKYS